MLFRAILTNFQPKEILICFVILESAISSLQTESGLMGSSQNKDPTIQIYLTLSKRMYYAGETVQGVVHIDCKANRAYNQLFIHIHGSENVHWTEQHHKTTIHYNNHRDTYDVVLPLAQFSMGIKTGQYSFPFALLLPGTLPASFGFGWNDNYIHYTISAELPAYDEKSSMQGFERSLHIREPCRLLQKNFSVTQVSSAKCCSCCCVCGEAQLTLQSDAVSLMQQQIFRVRGMVDNTHGSTHIKKFKVVLTEVTRQVSDWEYINESSDDFELFVSPNQIPVGASLPFNTEVKVPVKVLGYTAIGNILSRAYFLSLVADVNCCYSNPRISRHVVLNNTIQPQIEKQETIQAPPGWSPIVAGPISFLNLNPYIYNPSASIVVKNQIGQANNLIAMNQISSNVMMQA